MSFEIQRCKENIWREKLFISSWWSPIRNFTLGCCSVSSRAPVIYNGIGCCGGWLDAANLISFQFNFSFGLKIVCSEQIDSGCWCDAANCDDLGRYTLAAFSPTKRMGCHDTTTIFAMMLIEHSAASSFIRGRESQHGHSPLFLKRVSSEMKILNNIKSMLIPGAQQVCSK